MKVENGTLVCNDEVVPDYLTDAEDKDAIVRVELGPAVRKIGISAFSSCPHLEEIVFSEGVEEIGRCAFAHCKRLTSVTLPKNLRVVGGGAFVGCECLADVGFEPGGLVYIALDRVLPFRMCAGRIQIERKIAQENARRGRVVLNRLYEALMGAGHPYVAGYEEACRRFERVEWGTASEEDLRELIYTVDNKVAHLGAYANCSMTESEWNAADKTDCRMLCARIACRPGDADFIEEQRKEFNLLFGGNKKARFNRMVAALLPDRVVQIPSEEALNLLADWLKLNGLLDQVPASGDSWYVTSSAIRNCISAILTEKTVYECGVFCWFLTEALRGTNKDHERQERIQAVRRFLESCGRLFT